MPPHAAHIKRKTIQGVVDGLVFKIQRQKQIGEVTDTSPVYLS